MTGMTDPLQALADKAKEAEVNGLFWHKSWQAAMGELERTREDYTEYRRIMEDQRAAEWKAQARSERQTLIVGMAIGVATALISLFLIWQISQGGLI